MCAGVPGGSLEGPWGSLGSLGCLRSGIPSKPKQIKRTYCFFNIFKNIFLLLCRANNPIIVKGWLDFGAFVGYPLSAIVLLHFLMQFLIRKPMFFLMAIFQKLENYFLFTSSFILCLSFFLLWPSCFLKFPHISCSFLLCPSFFSLKSKNSAFLENCNTYFWGILNSIIVGGLSKKMYVKLVPSNLTYKHIFWGAEFYNCGGTD